MDDFLKRFCTCKCAFFLQRRVKVTMELGVGLVAATD